MSKRRTQVDIDHNSDDSRRETDVSQQANRHSAERRQQYQELMRDVPAKVKGLSGRIQKLYNDFGMRGSASQMAAEQQRLIQEQEALYELMGYVRAEGAVGGWEKLADTDGDEATEARHQGYQLVGNLVLDPHLKESLPEEYQRPGGELEAFVESARLVNDAESRLQDYLTRLSAAQVIVTASVRPRLQKLQQLAGVIADVKEKMEALPLLDDATEKLDMTRFAEARKLVKDYEDVAGPNAQSEAESARQAQREVLKDFTAKFQSLVDGEVARKQVAWNEMTNAKGDLGRKATNFFDLSSATQKTLFGGTIVPLRTVQKTLTEKSPEDVLATLEARLDRAYEVQKKFRQQVMEATYESNDKELLSLFNRVFPKATLKAGALSFFREAQKAELIREIYKALPQMIELLERQIVYVRTNRLSSSLLDENNACEPGVHGEYQVESQLQLEAIDAALDEYNSCERVVAQKHARFQELGEQYENAKRYRDAFINATQSPTGVARELWRQWTAAETEARTVMTEMGEAIAKSMKMEGEVVEAVSQALCLEFLPEDLRQMLLAQARNPQAKVLLGEGRSAVFFAGLSDQARQKVSSTTKQDELREAIQVAKDQRKVLEITLKDAINEQKIQELRMEILRLGESVAALDGKHNQARDQIYTDVEEICTRVERFCEVIKGQLSDLQETTTGAAAQFLNDLQRMTRTSESAGITLTLTTSELGDTKTALGLIEMVAGSEETELSKNVLDNVPSPVSSTQLTVREEAGRLTNALQLMGSADEVAKSRLQRNLRSLALSLTKAVEVSHEAIHVDGERMDQDANDILTAFVSATMLMSQDCRGLKKALDAARAQVARSEAELADRTAKLNEAQIARNEGGEFDQEVDMVIDKVDHPENSYRTTLTKLAKANEHLSRLQAEITKMEEDMPADETAKARWVKLKPAYAEKKAAKTRLEEEVIPTLEDHVAISRAKTRLWAESYLAREKDSKIAQFEKEVADRSRDLMKARAELRAKEMQFACAVSATSKLMDAQRALYTTTDMTQVIAATKITNTNELAVFIAKMKELGPRNTAFTRQHGQEIREVKLAEEVYENLIAKTLERAGVVRETVGSDFVVAQWARTGVEELLGMNRLTMAAPTDAAPAEEVLRITASDEEVENLVPGEAASDEATPDEPMITDMDIDNLLPEGL